MSLDSTDLCMRCRIGKRPIKWYQRLKEKITYCSREALCKACAANATARGFTLKLLKEGK